MGALMLSAHQYPQTVYATCKYSDNALFVQNTQTINFDIPNLSIVRDAPIGTLVYSASKYSPQTAEFLCDSTDTIGVKNNYPGGTVDSNNIYTLGDSGLGYKLRHPMFSDYFVPYPSPASYGWKSVGGKYPIKLEIYKIGNMKNKTSIKGGTFSEYSATPLTPLILTMSGFEIISPTCELNNAIPVSMGKQNTGGFKGPNSRLPAIAFNIPLRNCPTSENGISIQLDPTTKTLNNDTVAALDETSTAKGIGIQILMNNVPVKFGTQFPISSTTTSGGSFNIGLAAAYIQTNNKVTAGSANTSVTFTLNYK
ncbi:fimbrial protein [Pseudomonas sp. KCJK9016]|uniref:fimbrial protein n=1 Tax=Pseudomonas sp. KCJK9016 TaxID=3344556 RepID=UPI0039066D78